MTTNVNTAYYPSQTFESTGTESYTGGNSSAVETDIEHLLSDLGMSGGSFPGMGNTSPFPGGSAYPGLNTYPGGNPYLEQAGFPGSQTNGNPPLQSVKISSRSGGEVNLLEDPMGNLYDQKGKSVGKIGADGSVNFNQDGKSEVSKLMFGNNGNFLFHMGNGQGIVTGTEGSDGSYTFAPDQVNVGVGNLNLGSTTQQI